MTRMSTTALKSASCCKNCATRVSQKLASLPTRAHNVLKPLIITRYQPSVQPTLNLPLFPPLRIRLIDPNYLPFGSIQKPDSRGTSLADVKLLTPFWVVRPPMCVGKNYQEHVKEVDSWKGPGITQPSVPTVSTLFFTLCKGFARGFYFLRVGCSSEGSRFQS